MSHEISYRFAFGVGIMTGVAVGFGVYYSDPGQGIIRKIDEVLSPKPLILGDEEFWKSFNKTPEIKDR